MDGNPTAREYVIERVDFKSKIIEISVLILTANIILLGQPTSINVSKNLMVGSSFVLMFVVAYASGGMLAERATLIKDEGGFWSGLKMFYKKIMVDLYQRFLYHDPIAVLFMVIAVVLMGLSIVAPSF